MISLNTNLAAAYQASEKLSIGAAVTVGFGLAQLGTIGTTSSVHDIGLGGSIGATYAIGNGIMSSLTVKSPVRYNFKNILHNNQNIGVHQDLTLEQPLEIIAGIALDDVLADGLLVEADVIWKNWANAEAYQDVHDDQFLIALGAQYKSGKWAYRAGYSFAENMLLNETNDTIGSFATIGRVPFTAEVVKTLQVSLLPVIWQHTITVGLGYNITETISMDAYAAYAFGEEYSTGSLPLTAAEVGLESLELEAQVDYELMVGVGINLSL
ncbi:membrane protein involved in aromatic hydrocarbon degradation [uncultured Candidatus Thioglobus sp.]|nr:membrane protein involved in aromatic hydrocarbon degradation [uncultured Candidatus Thioglobus sp.]